MLELARWTAKDFDGAAGLFGIELDLAAGFGKPAVDAMLNRLRVFGLSHSYGVYESLIVPADPVSHRLPGTWAARCCACMLASRAWRT